VRFPSAISLNSRTNLEILAHHPVVLESLQGGEPPRMWTSCPHLRIPMFSRLCLMESHPPEFHQHQHIQVLGLRSRSSPFHVGRKSSLPESAIHLILRREVGYHSLLLGPRLSSCAWWIRDTSVYTCLRIVAHCDGSPVYTFLLVIVAHHPLRA
jgi:hypothetical protein